MGDAEHISSAEKLCGYGAADRERYERILSCYRSGQAPWDRADPPPEVLAYAPTLPVGRALDLGCGFGRGALFLARLGWEVDAIDFIPLAIEEAQRRAQQAGLAEKIHFHLAPVEQLDFLEGPYDFALDVGCAHNFTPEQLRRYHAGLARLLRPGAVFLWFAHLNEEDATPERRRWLDEAQMRAIFAAGFTLERVEYGQTQVGDQPPWRSAWFWFRRVENDEFHPGDA
ncbi:MAG: class I SAM-dependent methyltransferase [Caldilinea sp.]|nr:class I SAM-dependent methyltransferase [Caldilinea sp.]MDW8440291.1 class I SAM-dependent methyltransferase [Caldilineaceae bacterium]